MNQKIQKHWKSSFMSPSRLDNYIYHRDNEPIYQVEIWDKASEINSVPQWLDAVYCSFDGCLSFKDDFSPKYTTVFIGKFTTIAAIRDFISNNIYSLIEHGFRTFEESHLNKFICDLLKITPTNRKMLAGTAVHSYIERLIDGVVPDKFMNDGWTISVNPKLDVSINLPENAEIKISKMWQDIMINGKLDRLGNGRINDIKTTSKIDTEKYFDSYQWRVYLWMMGENYTEFIYNIFLVKLNNVLNEVTINDYMDLKLHRYDNLEIDVNNLLSEYSDYLDHIKPHINRLKEATN